MWLEGLVSNIVLSSGKRCHVGCGG